MIMMKSGPETILLDFWYRKIMLFGPFVFVLHGETSSCGFPEHQTSVMLEGRDSPACADSICPAIMQPPR